MSLLNRPDTSSSVYLDFNEFQTLKKDARAGEKSALEATAKQLESVFLNLMLKSMRSANSVFAEGSYLNSREGNQYQEMYDQQLSLNMANGHGIGLAEMIVKQMSRLQKADADATAVPATPAQKNDVHTHTSGAAEPSAEQLRHDREAELLRTLAVQQPETELPAPEWMLFAVEQEQPEPPLPPLDVTTYLEKESKSETWKTPEEFVAAILPHAQWAGRELGIDPQGIVAQAVLETGWGQRQIKDANGNQSFNLFGIKAGSRWDGEVARTRTLEYRNGIAAPEYASFRSYSSLRDAFADYVNFLKERSRYEGAFTQGKDAKQWGFALQKAGYATDPKYGNKIAGILESDILQSTFNPGYKSL